MPLSCIWKTNRKNMRIRARQADKMKSMGKHSRRRTEPQHPRFAMPKSITLPRPMLSECLKRGTKGPKHKRNKMITTQDGSDSSFSDSSLRKSLQESHCKMYVHGRACSSNIQFSTGSEEEHRRLVFIKFKVVAENAHQEVHQQNGDTDTGDVEEDVGLNLPCMIQWQEAGLSAVLAPKWHELGFQNTENLLAEPAVDVVWSWVWVNRFPLLPVGLVGGVQPFEFEEIEVPKNAQANDLHQSGVDRCWLLPHLQVVVSMGCCQNASPSDQKERQCVFQSRNDGGVAADPSTSRPAMNTMPGARPWRRKWTSKASPAWLGQGLGAQWPPTRPLCMRCRRCCQTQTGWTCLGDSDTLSNAASAPQRTSWHGNIE